MTAPEFAGGPDPNPPVPAATVVCLRPGLEGPEVLMLRRRARGAFAGMWVFPGGKVDPGDRATGDQATDQTTGDQTTATGGRATGEEEVAAAGRAAVREAAEEAGVVVDPATLVPLSWWLPPPEATRRFSTWFFVAGVVGDEPIVLSRDEVLEHRWVRPDDVLAAHRAGEVALAPPTWTTLQWLRRFGDVDELLAAAAGREPEQYRTRAVLDAGGRLLATLWEGDVAYADDQVDLDPDRPGPRRRMLDGADGWLLVLDPVPGPA